jgi:ParB-like nuclease domain
MNHVSRDMLSVRIEGPKRLRKKLLESHVHCRPFMSLRRPNPVSPKIKKPAAVKETELIHQVEVVPLENLKAHPSNYRKHPQDELEHLGSSIREHGVYKNVVVARDGTILAGHGVVEAAKKIGLKNLPVIRLDVAPDSAKARRVLVGDNEIAHLTESDDRLLTELLKDIRESDKMGLSGTGYDEKMLANLLLVTRPVSEIQGINEAEHWVGMPEYGQTTEPIYLVMRFRNEKDREKFVEEKKLTIMKKEARSWSAWWPERIKDDSTSVKFEAGKVGKKK